MEKQYLIIHNYPALYDILDEIKSKLSFNIKKIDDDDLIKQKYNYNYLIISNLSLKIENQIKIEEAPIEIAKLIDLLNISFLKKKNRISKRY